MADLTCILVKAITADDLSKIARLFANANRKSSLLFCRDANGNEPIHVASSHGSEDIVKLLVKLGSDADKENEYGWTPLMLASFYGRVAVVRFLLSLKSVNPQKNNSFGLNSLKCCIYGFHDDVMDLLLEQNIDVNHGGTQGLGMTALMIACRVKNHNAVRNLILSGSDCNYQSKSNGWTALFYAIHPDDYSLVKLLLDAKAEPNISDWSGKTPKTVAKELGCDTDSMFELIEDFRDLNAKDKLEFGESASNLFSKNRRLTNKFQKADIPIDSGIERAASNTRFSINKVPSHAVEGKRDSTPTREFSKMYKGVSDQDHIIRTSVTEKPIIKGVWWNTVGKK